MFSYRRKVKIQSDIIAFEPAFLQVYGNGGLFVDGNGEAAKNTSMHSNCVLC